MWGGHLPILWPWYATLLEGTKIFFYVIHFIMATDHYSSKDPIEIDFPVKEFPQSPWGFKMSNFWTFCQFFYEASHSREARIASFSQDSKKARKIKTGVQASIVFLGLWASCCNVPLDISAPFDSPELCLCWVLLARVMPKRQRILNREL